MSRILLLRSDNRIQRYNIKRGNLKRYESSLLESEYKGVQRTRRVYSRLVRIEKEKIPSGGTGFKPFEGRDVKDVRNYKEVNSIFLDVPIYGRTGQIHVKIKGYRKGETAIAHGYSYLDDPTDTGMKEKMINEATRHAISELPWSPERVEPIYYDYCYIVKKTEYSTYSPAMRPSVA